MKTFVLLLLSLTIAVPAMAQDPVALDPALFVNTQILADTLADGTRPNSVYTVASGEFYAFDGRLDVTFPLEITGPDGEWIRNMVDPPALVNTADINGDARDFFDVLSGGSLTLKNLLLSGLVSTGPGTTDTGGSLINLDGASSYTAHNVAFANWQDFLVRNRAKGIDISITDCVFINGVRLQNSPWGGFPIRMDVAGENVTIENNTVVNSGRLLTNSGPFNNATIHELHNTYLNSTKAGHEFRANEMIQANNMYYNFDFLGRTSDANTYNSYWTTWNHFYEAADSLDKVSLYQGQNLFFREAAQLEYFTTQADTVLPGLLWEHAAVDSFIVADDDFTIGTNYAEIDPVFTQHPGNSEQVLGYTTAFHAGDDWVDWRITNPLDFDAAQQPMLNWPPDFDLSYESNYLKTAGTDGLPIGDLNWYPDSKTSYMANRDAHIASLRDSITSAVAVYVPGNPTPLDTNPTGVANEDDTNPSAFGLSQNYPNPFNPTTNISFNLPSTVNVKLTVYNMFGQRIAVLLDNESRVAGQHSVQWDARDDLGKSVASGQYIYKLQAGDFTQSRTMLLLK